MYSISYCLVFAVHPKLDNERIVIFKSFWETLHELSILAIWIAIWLKKSIQELQISCKTALSKFSKNKEKFANFEMFSCELKFTSDIPKKWFSRKCKRRFLELDTLAKMRYEKGNPIDYLKAKSSTCDFKLLLGSANGPESEKMT